jgi:membrane-bound ClpP family serine protease
MQQNINNCSDGFSWLTWAHLVITPVLEFTNNNTLGCTILVIITGLDHCNKNLAGILLALERDILILYDTVSPTWYMLGLQLTLYVFATLLLPPVQVSVVLFPKRLIVSHSTIHTFRG